MHKSQFIDSTIQKYVDEHSLRLNKAQRQLLDYSLSLRKILINQKKIDSIK